jgi:ribosomal protein L11 methyltransferase
MKKYFQIQIETRSPNEAEILIAALSEIQFYAFDGNENFLNAYVKEEDFDEVKLKEILPANRSFKKYIIEEENWNQKWESGIKPVIVNDFVAIRPVFAQPINNVKHDLIITPKMSFGTGHHATTFLMIQMMEKMDFNDKSVIDFGTGTGVLAILAEKCGASRVTAVDHDEWSIQNARENIAANNCHHIILKKQSNPEGVGTADILLANINLNVLKHEVSSLSSATKSGSFLLASGFLVSDENEIQNNFEKWGFVKYKSEQLDGWLAILFKRN